MDKKVIKTGLLLLIVFAVLGMSACSVRPAIPQDGVFYCNELGISIDFSIMKSDPKCGKVYAPDGTYTTCRCMIDYGSGIWICSPDQETDYLFGKFLYINDLFYVISDEDGTRYVFERRDKGTVCVNPNEKQDRGRFSVLS
jgi:hypothetical protein